MSLGLTSFWYSKVLEPIHKRQRTVGWFPSPGRRKLHLNKRTTRAIHMFSLRLLV